MGNLIVRKARKDYVCDFCGHIIKAGTEYIDNIVIKYGNVIKHERYHDECPVKKNAELLMKRIIDDAGDLICSDPDGEKHHIIGLQYNGPTLYVVTKDWDGGITPLTIEQIKEWVDSRGERILFNE